MKKIKVFAIYFFGGFILPLLFVANAFIVPEPYSHLLIDLALLPSKIVETLFYFLPIFDGKKLLNDLTLLVFGHPTQNAAPILIVLLFVFWFFTSMLILFIYRSSKSKSNLS